MESSRKDPAHSEPSTAALHEDPARGAMPTAFGGAAAHLGRGVMQWKLRNRAIQRKLSGLEPQGAAATAQAPSGGGEPLPKELGAQMGHSLGADFSAVRVHTGEHVSQMGAHAYTQGSDIHFAPGQYQPDTQAGRELLGHELAHVQQQGQGRVAATAQAHGLPVNDDGGLEKEADERGALAARGERAGGGHGGGAGGGEAVQRKAAHHAPLQAKLKMTAGYTEMVNWSGEARALIAAYDKLVELHEGLQKTMTGPTFKSWRRTKLKPISQYRSQLEAKTIPNDHKVRVNQTLEIEQWIATATRVQEEVNQKSGQKPQRSPGGINGGDPLGETNLVEHVNEEVKAEGEGVSDLNPMKPPRLGPEEQPPEQPSVGEQAISLVEIKLFDVVKTGGALLETMGVNGAKDVEELKVEKGGRLGQVSGEVTGGGKYTYGQGGQHKVKAQLKLVMGKSNEFNTDLLDVGELMQGHKAQLRGKLETTVGGKTDLSLEHSASYNLKDGFSTSLKGSTSAFLGGSVEISPQVRIVDSSGRQLSALSVTGGMSYGIGGAYEGEISFEKGTLVFRSKGKLAAGLGMSWGLSAELNLGDIVSKLLGY